MVGVIYWFYLRIYQKQQNLNGPDKSLSSAQNRDALCRHKNCIIICGVGKPSLHNGIHGTSINNRKTRDTSNIGNTTHKTKTNTTNINEKMTKHL